MDVSKDSAGTGRGVRDRSPPKSPNPKLLVFWGLGDMTSVLHGSDIPAVVVSAGRVIM
jgi:hypothetical protein